MKGPRPISSKVALMTAALLLLPACSPRKSIPSDPPEARPEAEVRAERQHRPPHGQPPQAVAKSAQPKGPVVETVVAEVKDPQTTDAQIKTAVAKAEARQEDPLASALADEARRDQTTKADSAAKTDSAPKADAQSNATSADKAAADTEPEGAQTAKNGDTSTPAPANAANAAPANAEKTYMVQIASFSTEKNADSALAWLKDMGYAQARKVRVEQGGTAYLRVQAGPFQDLAAARKVLEELKADWPQAFIPAD